MRNFPSTCTFPHASSIHREHFFILLLWTNVHRVVWTESILWGVCLREIPRVIAAKPETPQNRFRGGFLKPADVHFYKSDFSSLSRTYTQIYIYSIIVQYRISTIYVIPSCCNVSAILWYIARYFVIRWATRTNTAICGPARADRGSWLLVGNNFLKCYTLYISWNI